MKNYAKKHALFLSTTRSLLLSLPLLLGASILEGATAACASAQEAQNQQAAQEAAAAVARGEQGDAHKAEPMVMTLQQLMATIDQKITTIKTQKCPKEQKNEQYRREVVPLIASYYFGKMDDARQASLVSIMTPKFAIEAYLNKQLGQKGIEYVIGQYRQDCQKHLSTQRHLCGWNSSASAGNWQDDSWRLPCAEDDGLWRPLQYSHTECPHKLPSLLDSEIVKGCIEYYEKMFKFYESHGIQRWLLYWGLQKSQNQPDGITIAELIDGYKADQDKAAQDKKGKKVCDISSSVVIKRLKEHEAYARFNTALYSVPSDKEPLEQADQELKGNQKAAVDFLQPFISRSKVQLSGPEAVLIYKLLNRKNRSQIKDLEKYDQGLQRLLLSLLDEVGNDDCLRAVVLFKSLLAEPTMFRDQQVLSAQGTSYREIASLLVCNLVSQGLLDRIIDVNSYARFWDIIEPVRDYIRRSVEISIRYCRDYQEPRDKYVRWEHERDALMLEYDACIKNEINPELFKQEGILENLERIQWQKYDEASQGLLTAHQAAAEMLTIDDFTALRESILAATKRKEMVVALVGAEDDARQAVQGSLLHERNAIVSTALAALGFKLKTCLWEQCNTEYGQLQQAEQQDLQRTRRAVAARQKAEAETAHRKKKLQEIEKEKHRLFSAQGSLRAGIRAQWLQERAGMMLAILAQRQDASYVAIAQEHDELFVRERQERLQAEAATTQRLQAEAARAQEQQVAEAARLSEQKKEARLQHLRYLYHKGVLKKVAPGRYAYNPYAAAVDDVVQAAPYAGQYVAQPQYYQQAPVAFGPEAAVAVAPQGPQFQTATVGIVTQVPGWYRASSNRDRRVPLAQTSQEEEEICGNLW